ncbi:MAG: class I SAM-dependent rRNA methyltransferase, partial [Spirochaetia bacterium]|nr:class I SAM-dependent rRNA methyltransferase [Spirochaetia bacterium]
FGQLPDFLDVSMDDLPFRLRLGAAQKTGFFLDQKCNQRQIGNWSRGLRVLDCFCNQGGFSLQAARGGAREILGLDSSDEAISSAKENAVLFSQKHPDLKAPLFQTADVFDFLNAAKDRGDRWDLVIVDPPAFAKNKKSAIPALKAYARLNQAAFEVLADEGILATGSCSMHVEEERFFQAVEQAAFKTGKKLSWLSRGGQAPDHPILAVMSETRYLKWGVFRVEPLALKS